MIDFVKKHVKKIAAGAGVMTIAAVFVVTNLTTPYAVYADGTEAVSYTHLYRLRCVDGAA